VLVSQTVTRLLEAASLTVVRETFRSARRWLFLGALMTAAGVGVFTWAVNPPKSPKDAPATVRLTPMRTVDVALSEEGARLLSPQLGGKCDTKRLRTLTPQETKSAGVPMTSMPTRECQAVQFVLTQQMGSIVVP
jgi:hypothetical protein